MKYQNRKKALILLADGTIFDGKSVGGKEGTVFGEACFNTGMTGYQEIFTDPSYFGQLMVTTNAHIGNYGVAENEIESDSIKISGLICRNFSYHYSRDLANDSLATFLDKNNLLAIADVDTRSLVAYIRDNGAMNAVITTDIENINILNDLDEIATIKENVSVTIYSPNFDGLNNPWLKALRAYAKKLEQLKDKISKPLWDAMNQYLDNLLIQF